MCLQCQRKPGNWLGSTQSETHTQSPILANREAGPNGLDCLVCCIGKAFFDGLLNRAVDLGLKEGLNHFNDGVFDLFEPGISDLNIQSIQSHRHTLESETWKAVLVSDNRVPANSLIVFVPCEIPMAIDDDHILNLEVKVSFKSNADAFKPE